jgi:hypothetical protein
LSQDDAINAAKTLLNSNNVFNEKINEVLVME